MHQAALAVQPVESPMQMESFNPTTISRGRRRRGLGGLAVRAGLDSTNTALELEKRVKALEVAVAEEEKSVAPPFYSEEELMLLYEDLLAIPSKPPPPPVDLAALEQHLAQQDTETILEAERRLLQTYPEVSSRPLEGDQQHLPKEMQTYHNVLVHAQRVVSQLEEMRGLATRGSDLEGHPVAGPSRISVPISVLSVKECESLVRVCTKAQDGPRALLTLEIMKRSGMPIPENAITDTLELLAATGNTQASESLIANFITTPTERQRHLHVKAHLKATPPDTLPTSALSVLHAYEERALFAPMQTYTRCISTLLGSSSAVSRAQGWDLFTHMRYVAHPNPDVWLYTYMIRACAYPLTSSRSSEPEKALDIWTEMTVDRKLEPTVQAWNAVILACARSGEKTFVNEAYRLAKQMMDAFRDARGVSAFGPDKKTFIALLEGAKRVGDLGRARWILAEIVRGSGAGMEVEGVGEVHVDEEVMMHLFQAYAIYQPPFKREATVVVQGENDSTQSAADASTSNDVPPETTSPESNGSTSLTLDSMPSFSHIPPQSHEEVLGEATFLFQRILHDTGVMLISPEHDQQGPHFSPNLVDKFSKVELSTRLLASYMSIFFRHASLDLAQRMFWRIFDQLSVPRTARVYVETLEGCAYGRKGSEKSMALRFAEDVWVKWKEIEDSGRDCERALSPRMIERAYCAKLRLLAVNDEVAKALSLVHAFVQRYPPSSIRIPPEKSHLRSTRTSLVGGARPLVRMTSAAEVPDDSVPPLLTFRDLQVLHHRLVGFDAEKELNYLKWVSKSYEWMLRVRRDEAFKAKPVKPSAKPEEID